MQLSTSDAATFPKCAVRNCRNWEFSNLMRYGDVTAPSNIAHDRGLIAIDSVKEIAAVAGPSRCGTQQQQGHQTFGKRFHNIDSVGMRYTCPA